MSNSNVCLTTLNTTRFVSTRHKTFVILKQLKSSSATLINIYAVNLHEYTRKCWIVSNIAIVQFQTSSNFWTCDSGQVSLLLRWQNNKSQIVRLSFKSKQKTCVRSHTRTKRGRGRGGTEDTRKKTIYYLYLLKMLCVIDPQMFWKIIVRTIFRMRRKEKEPMWTFLKWRNC